MAWSDHELLESLRRWAAAHDGYAPRYDDWASSSPSTHPDWLTGDFPTSETVRKRFGGWHAAVVRAGLIERPPRPRPSSQEERVCPTCLATHLRRPSERTVFCSIRCAARFGLQGRIDEVLALRRQGLTNVAIAAITGDSPKAVTNLIYRARQEGLDVVEAPYWGDRSASPPPTYVSWTAMKQRCLDRSGKDWPLYGGRGITFCDRWRDYATFVADMGERPPGTTLDRIDPDGNYEPGNCRWATHAEQAANKRRR